MYALLNLALVNAITVLPLAVLAYGVGRVSRNAALKHLLWVLVLVKFVTPPVVNVPMTVLSPVEQSTPDESTVPFEPAEFTNSAIAAADSLPQFADQPATQVLDAHATNVAGGAGIAIADGDQASFETTRDTSSTGITTWGASLWNSILNVIGSVAAYWNSNPVWQSLLLWTWLAGAAFWSTIQITRAVRFERLIANSTCSHDELQQQVDSLAERLGLRRVPRVLVIEAPVSPMLWGCGRWARLLFPADLARRLDTESRATLLTHELGHYSRGDHLVRLLELCTTCLFWWHPVVWWARHHIEQAEEECCDAWVVRQFPRAPRRYAEALLDTIDFLCEARTGLPPVASGLGQAPFLRRRLTHILQGPPTKPLSVRLQGAIWLAAAAILPLQPFAFAAPSLSQNPTPDETQFVSLTLPTTPSLPDSEGSATKNSPGQETSPGSNSLPPSAQPKQSRRPGTGRVRTGQVWATAVSPNGQFMIRATTSRQLLLVDLVRNTEADLSDQNITAVAFSPDSRWFAAAGSDGRVTLWDTATFELQRLVATHTSSLRSIAVAPEGQLLAAASPDGTILILDLSTNEPATTLPRLSQAVNCVRFSPDGKTLAVAAGDWAANRAGTVTLLDTMTGETLKVLKCDTAAGALAFASNDELIVGLWEGRTQLWNLVTGNLVAEAQADKRDIAAAAFSPENPILRAAIFQPVDQTASVPEESSPTLFDQLLNSRLTSPVP